MLALICSVVVEALFVAAYYFFGTITQFGTLANFWSRSFFWFHTPAAIITDHCVTMNNGSIWQDIVGYVIFFIVALLEWWLMFFAAIRCIRYSPKKLS
jgi:hypothetical protein